MQERPKNRFAYATLIEHALRPDRPEILLELGMENPVDWDAVDDEGRVICGKLDFRLMLGEVAVLCVLDRVYRDFGLHDGAHVYVLVLRPAPDAKGRPTHAIALETAEREARLRGRVWQADVAEILVSWRHAPESCAAVENAAYVPEPARDEAPQATDDEVRRLCDAFDAFCDGIADDDTLPLDEIDLEYVSWPPPLPDAVRAA